MSTKEREIKPIKRKTKKLKSSGRNSNKTSDENQALAKDKNDLLRQIDLLRLHAHGYEVERAKQDFERKPEDKDSDGRGSERRVIRTREKRLRTQERQTHIDRAVITLKKQ
ncbi:hypothetical protein TNCV_3689871 [Trichonephila clavipes]|uniref:Uncharacterized protein n=1 Tax=Trichonephila clavipes TaxID=2585209 RepID=A0A8X6VQA0_TRICX|nr:hypothetical protein TNCV_3689871 [Trichonephila clavipes]